MCEKNDFLKALMPCRGRKIIIHPAGSFTKYWNHISNFCFHLVLLWIYKHMFHFQILFYFFCLCGNFQKCWTEKKSWVDVIPIMFLLGIAKAHLLWWKNGRVILEIGHRVCVCVCVCVCVFLNIFNFLSGRPIYYKACHPIVTEVEFLFFFYKFIYLFIYFCLRWVFVAARGLSLVAVTWGYSSLQCAGFSLRWPLLRSTSSRRVGFSSCCMWAQ